AWNLQTARLAREHNNANVVGIGARMHTTEEALEIIDAFLAEPYSNEPRHQRRIEILASLEA
ncbi:MAG: RpiB/LacA/LacB family sugar-phosphate isomerase, partial [Actinomyces graevenitzii]|nr:RpiB/LacA/LacB family sugar-phosphate isomerase [Actinomyces graevenitzii]